MVAPNSLKELVAEYRHYSYMPEFKEGFVDYQLGLLVNPYAVDRLEAQAWDRGAECAMRWARYSQSRE